MELPQSSTNSASVPPMINPLASPNDISNKTEQLQLPPSQPSAEEQYFEALLSTIKSKGEVSKAAKELVVAAEEAVLKSIEQKGVLSPKKVKNHSPSLTNDPAIKLFLEESAKKLRLQESKRSKQELEAKLRIIHTSINAISAQELQLLQDHGKKEYSWLTEKDRQKWKEEWKKKTEEANEFARKMREYQKEKKKKKEEKQRMLLEKLQKEEAERKELEAEQAKIQEAKKKEQMAKKLEEYNAKREERKMLLELAKNGPGKKPYLYEKMQEKYITEVEMPELEKRKKNLAEKRNIYKPLRREELESHQKTFDDVLRKREEERKNEVEKWKMDAAEYLSRVKQEYKTSFMEEVLKKDQEEKEKQKALLIQQKEAYNKKMVYAKIVKESCVPHISETKVLELKQNIERLKHPVRKPKPTKRESWTGNQTTVKEREGDQTEKTNRSDTEENVKPKKKLRIKKKQAQNTVPVSPRETSHEQCKKKAIDYLAEMRKNRENVNVPSKNYETLLKKEDISLKEKYELLKVQAEIIEENARRKEQLMNVKGESKNDKAGQEVSDMYINAIKAKLSLLDL